MQSLRSELRETPVPRPVSAPAKIATPRDDEEEEEVSEIVDLIRGIVYWSILVVGTLVPPIGAVYSLFTH